MRGAGYSNDVGTTPGWPALLQAIRDDDLERDRSRLLADAVALGRDVASQVVGCSMTVGGTRGWTTPQASRPVAMSLDLAQYRAGTGPCVEAAITGSVQQLDPIAADPRFDAFAEAAARHGVLSSLSVPLPGAPEPSALNLYANELGAFHSRRASQVADLLARLIATLLGSPDGTRAPVSETSDLATARGAVVRSGVEALARRSGTSHEAAYRILAERSRHEARPIIGLAREFLPAGETGVATR